tara:strand:- start:6 stop:653 length:648 start_codon:yes stop_codon:yes gene_type:complete
MNRKRQHKSTCNNQNNKQYNIKLYTFIRDNGGWENWDMVLIANYICVDNFEAYKFERLHYVEINATLNIQYPGRTKKESFALYRANNVEKEKARHTLYSANNVEKEKARSALYRANNIEKLKEAGVLYRANNVEKIKERSALYSANNVEKIKARSALYSANNVDKNKEYRIINADKIKARKTEVKTCDCGKTYQHDSYARHCKTQYHLKNIIIYT